MDNSENFFAKERDILLGKNEHGKDDYGWYSYWLYPWNRGIRKEQRGWFTVRESVTMSIGYAV